MSESYHQLVRYYQAKDGKEFQTLQKGRKVRSNKVTTLDYANESFIPNTSDANCTNVEQLDSYAEQHSLNRFSTFNVPVEQFFSQGPEYQNDIDFKSGPQLRNALRSPTIEGYNLYEQHIRAPEDSLAGQMSSSARPSLITETSAITKFRKPYTRQLHLAINSVEDSRIFQKNKLSNNSKNSTWPSSSSRHQCNKIQIHGTINHGSDNLRFNVATTHIRYNQESSQNSRKIRSPFSKDIVESSKTSDNGLWNELHGEGSGEEGNMTSKTASRVILVRGVDPRKITLRELCNLFSNYGNVEVGFMHMDKQFSLIEFCSKDAAILCMKHCNKISVQDCKLNLYYSRFDNIDQIGNDKNMIYFKPDASCRRYKLGVPIQANPISRTLHVCIFYRNKRRYVQDSEVLPMLNSIAQPTRVQRDVNKDNQNMWFMEFADTSAAIEVLMKVHDARYEEANLRISFTKTKRS